MSRPFRWIRVHNDFPVLAIVIGRLHIAAILFSHWLRAQFRRPRRQWTFVVDDPPRIIG
jgi:hypothetical protein